MSGMAGRSCVTARGCTKRTGVGVTDPAPAGCGSARDASPVDERPSTSRRVHPSGGRTTGLAWAPFPMVDGSTVRHMGECPRDVALRAGGVRSALGCRVAGRPRMALRTTRGSGGDGRWNPRGRSRVSRTVPSGSATDRTAGWATGPSRHARLRGVEARRNLLAVVLDLRSPRWPGALRQPLSRDSIASGSTPPVRHAPGGCDPGCHGVECRATPSDRSHTSRRVGGCGCFEALGDGGSPGSGADAGGGIRSRSVGRSGRARRGSRHTRICRGTR